ncbi:hypothetical protein [Desulfofundulus thermosubterraneus]|uniref:Uncharacterized protein n=1 Tax=Desulfofundulus thermosubterraneus DSM 16057 TaxID=1121432 RepID=A0A1M6MQ53_9FIRM|nr:hypothetical protein [Desulfofundulus thermosubterraneus]SHJ85618.1 hypothetical protein SAMN02745219_03500 [Desulfofundulus thermosubterraneus DSM 16057]
MYMPSKEEQLSFYHPNLILARMFGHDNFITCSGKNATFCQGRALYAVVLSRQWPSYRFTGNPVQSAHFAAVV